MTSKRNWEEGVREEGLANAIVIRAHRAVGDNLCPQNGKELGDFVRVGSGSGCGGRKGDGGSFLRSLFVVLFL